MGTQFDPSTIEKVAQKLGILSNRTEETKKQRQRRGVNGDVDPIAKEGHLGSYPGPDQWNNWTEYDETGEPRDYSLVPTACFNCEAGCGLLTYIDKETGEIRKIEGNPEHPGSRGKNCAKGPATINQLEDTGRILHPLKRDGPRGSGQWTQVSWDEALDDIASEMRETIEDGRENEITYHVGRPGHEDYMDRVINAWGLDGHNSHTNICSSGARTGYALWHKYDRPSGDFANAEFILLLSAHLESGHYFNPHAQRIMEGMQDGGQLAVMDPRLSNTAAMSDYWLPTQPGSEAAGLLSMARTILDEDLYDAEFVRNWVNWEQFLDEKYPDVGHDFDAYIDLLREDVYADFTPKYAEAETGVDAEKIQTVARKIGRAGDRFASHIWRSAASGNEGGWQVSRTLHFLSVLTGSVGTKGGTSPNAWHAYDPELPNEPPRQKLWDELQLPQEWPFAHYELSQLLPYFLKEGRGELSVYFTRVFNPVYTYPDGFSWIEALTDEDKVGMHVALTPTWNETAYFADYVLPMGHSPERHDIQSQETHAATWVTYRQPVHREFAEREGEDVERTYEANPGEVWEEDEFWMDLSWRVDEDGELGIREHFESPYRDGEDGEPAQMTIDEYYRYVFENDERLVEEAEEAGMEPLEYMKHYGAFEASTNEYEIHEETLDESILEEDDVYVDDYGTIRRGEKPDTYSEMDGSDMLGVMVDGEPKRGFPTPTGKQQFYSKTMAEWGLDDPEYTLPHYIKSHVHPDEIDYENGERVLVPTFRLPTQIHSRSSNSKYLEEISHKNPVWIHTDDAARMGVETGDLVRVVTEIGYFVNEVWVTESIKPGIVAMSHHMGQWKINRDDNRDIEEGGDPYGKVTVDLDSENSQWGLRQAEGIKPFESTDPDSERVWWNDGGVAQNLTHAPHPDPISGMHCWHQKVTVRPAEGDDHYGDVYVDTDRAFEIYREWVDKTEPAPGPNNLRRPKWLKRPFSPPTGDGEDDAWYADGPIGRSERWDVDSRSPVHDDD
ncbi:molybdopterin dinucleotide binding domain-containing protein [Natrialbaceae archaeon AArc-T1-2]|uniref:molybdopterin dinucleotide binding domain-containing protein n=1 Tax=Natrialbaceae archaeon AArc-T1-2 TaxID=3053904 RepID=UPI00255B28D8|nr:molybdopterin dinucleotide binding domain-containing protein [Natrialbaceae archaeon AArc-T1-2]WIV68207.1 molybdopterin-dependent oxidoreductase [Natrialbaceae archaeon AArc-T1-2]